MPILFIDSGGASQTFLNHYEDATNLTSYTFAASTLDANAPFHVVAVHWQGAGAAETLSSVTIDGVLSTIIDQALNNRDGIALVKAAGAGHSSGTISVVLTGTSTRSAISVFALYGPGTVSSHTTNTAAAPTATLTVPDNSAVIAAVGGTGSSLTTTWTGLTERSDVNYDSGAGVLSSASNDFTTGNASLAVTATFSGAATAAGSFAVFGP